MKFSLAGKTSIITGGGSGIGRAIASTLAEQGAAVHIFERDLEAAEGIAEEINAGGFTAIAHRCDVGDQQAVLQTVKSIATKSGVDIVINNAGIAHIGNVEDTTEQDMDKLYRVNIKGVYNCIHAAIPYMKEKGGVIINMASVASSLGLAERFAYSMTKGAVLTMTYSVAKDYLEYDIRCNSISPARIHTPFVDGYLRQNYPGQEEEMFKKLSKTQPIGRMGNPVEVANLALYLCSDEASFITGTDFPIDGGYIKLNG